MWCMLWQACRGYSVRLWPLIISALVVLCWCAAGAKQLHDTAQARPAACAQHPAPADAAPATQHPASFMGFFVVLTSCCASFPIYMTAAAAMSCCVLWARSCKACHSIRTTTEVWGRRGYCTLIACPGTARPGDHEAVFCALCALQEKRCCVCPATA